VFLVVDRVTTFIAYRSLQSDGKWSEENLKYIFLSESEVYHKEIAYNSIRSQTLQKNLITLTETPDYDLFPVLEYAHRHLHAVRKILPQSVSVLWLLRDPPT